MTSCLFEVVNGLKAVVFVSRVPVFNFLVILMVSEKFVMKETMLNSDF